MEIEKKYRVTSHKPYLETAIQNGFKLSKEKHQIDTYFIVNKRFNDGTQHYLRIREDKIDNSFSVDYHRALNDLETEEFEVIINDKAKMVQILNFLGQELVCIIDKKRMVYKLGRVSLVFDEVKNLGFFIEIEIEGKMETQVLDKLNEISAMLTLDENMLVQGVGYPDLLLQTSSN